ncbi:MAG: hypothetical protein AABY07_02745, partial [Nanoarchaeota archaeon]
KEYVTLIFRSSSHYTVNLYIGDARGLDLNNDNKNDIEVKLNKIINNVAYLTLTRLAGSEFIKEGVPELEIPEDQIEEKPKTEFPKAIISKIKEIQDLPLLNISIVFIILITLVLIIIWLESLFSRKKRRK